MTPPTLCRFCGCPETAPGSHRPGATSDPKSYWLKAHEGHPNFAPVKG